jgi:hypothetical protein
MCVLLNDDMDILHWKECEEPPRLLDSANEHHFNSNEQVVTALAKKEASSIHLIISQQATIMGKRIEIVLLLLLAAMPAAVALVPHSVCVFRSRAMTCLARYFRLLCF